MPKELEIESKSMLKKEDFQALVFYYKNIKSYKQINYYISSEEMLKKVKDYGLRIRYKNKHFEITLKVSKDVGKLEINQQISKKSYVNLKYFKKFPSGEVKDYLDENSICDTSKLRIIGKLTTIRKDIKINDSLFSIDCSKYNHFTDYEIECENSDPKLAEKDLIQFLAKHNIEFKKSEHNKLARFLKTIN